MNDLKKYKDVILYLSLIVVMVVLLYQQLQPKFLHTVDLFNQVKTQKEVKDSIQNQLTLGREKAERQRKLNLMDDITKKIYTASGIATDTESTFAVLLDDIIEIARKNHIKTHSITSTLNPSEDVFVKGDGAKYSVNKLEMKIVSNYTDFENFISDLYSYHYLININGFEVYPYPKNKRILLINLTITMYSMKDASEVASSTQESANAPAPDANMPDANADTPAPEPASAPASNQKMKKDF